MGGLNAKNFTSYIDFAGFGYTEPGKEHRQAQIMRFLFVFVFAAIGPSDRCDDNFSVTAWGRGIGRAVRAPGESAE